MKIRHVGHSIIKTPHRKIHLRKILHVPSASKNLLSVHRIAIDNHVFLEFHPFFFLIKDQVTRKVLYRGRCVRGLYPLIPEIRRSNKQVLSATKLSSSRWHDRLGHATFSLVERVLRKNKLPYVGERDTEIICDSCKERKVISYLIQYLLVFLQSHYKSFLTCGDLLPPLLVDTRIMLASLMTIASTLGSIFSRKDPICFKSSLIFKHSLNENSIAKSLLSNLIGEGSMNN